MGCYYFIIGAFPPLVLGSKPELSYEEARDMLSLNLSTQDWKQVVLFQSQVDIRNIRALWLKEPISPRGNFAEKELEEALLIRDNLPPYVGAFLDRYETQEERLRYFPSLFASLYRETLPEMKGFILRYYQIGREIRLVLTALRAREAKRDLVREFQFEDPEDPFVAQLLAQKDTSEPVVPKEYEDLKIAFLENKSEPKKLFRSVLQITFSRIEELETGRFFTMDQVLGHLARLSIVEAWVALDEEKGRVVLEQICR